jgi:hypothetical protein
MLRDNYNGIVLNKMFLSEKCQTIESFFNRADDGDNYVMIKTEGMVIVDANPIDKSQKFILLNGLKIKLYVYENMTGSAITLERHAKLYNTVMNFNRHKVPVNVEGGYTCATMMVDKHSFISKYFLGEGEQDEYLCDEQQIIDAFETAFAEVDQETEEEDWIKLNDEFLEFKEFIDECGYIENILLIKW